MTAFPRKDEKPVSRVEVILSVAIFLFLGIYGVQYHEMWRDEIHGWLVARDMPSIYELVSYLAYEGHQSLWHLLVRPLTRLFPGPEAMQYLHVIIASATILLIFRYSPFSRTQKILLSFGYFFFYEYLFIARDYAIAVFLIFLVATLFPQRSKHPAVFATIIFFLFQTNVHALVVGLGITFTLIADAILKHRRLNLRTSAGKSLVGAVLIITTGLLTAMWQLYPPGNILMINGLERELYLSFDLDRLIELGRRVMSVFFPVCAFEEGIHCWGRFLIKAYPAVGLIALSSLAVIFGRFLVSHPASLFLVLSVTVGLLIISYTVYLGNARHHGFLFIALIFALWIRESCVRVNHWPIERWLPKVPKSLVSLALTTLLGIHVLGAIRPIYMDYFFPFSGGKQTAEFIKKNHLENLTVIAQQGHPGVSVAGYIGKKEFFYSDHAPSGQFSSFHRFDVPPRVIDQSIVVSDAISLLVESSPVLVILNQHLDRDSLDSTVSSLVNFEHIFQSSKNITEEEFYVYLATLNNRDQAKEAFALDFSRSGNGPKQSYRKRNGLQSDP